MEVVLQKKSSRETKFNVQTLLFKKASGVPLGFLSWALWFSALYHSDLSFLGALTFSNTSLG